MKNDLHLVCPHCQSINRVPTAKLSEHPNCGRCQQPLFTGEPIELTTATFSRHVERSDLPLLVDFWAPWCAVQDDGATVPASGAPARTEDPAGEGEYRG